MNEELKFSLYAFRAEVIWDIVIMFLKNIKKERGEFRLEVFFWRAGISFQILAPTLEKALVWISSLDFLI